MHDRILYDETTTIFLSFTCWKALCENAFPPPLPPFKFALFLGWTRLPVLLVHRLGLIFSLIVSVLKHTPRLLKPGWQALLSFRSFCLIGCEPWSAIKLMRAYSVASEALFYQRDERRRQKYVFAQALKLKPCWNNLISALRPGPLIVNMPWGWCFWNWKFIFQKIHLKAPKACSLGGASLSRNCNWVLTGLWESNSRGVVISLLILAESQNSFFLPTTFFGFHLFLPRIF